MKCKRVSCTLPAQRNKVYCSREHAPYGHFAKEKDVELEETESSSIKDLGDPLPRSCAVGPKRDPGPKKTEFIRENTTMSTWKGAVSIGQDTGPTTQSSISKEIDGIMQPIEKSILKKSTEEGGGASPPMVLSKASASLEQARSDSLTLIDDSARHLRDLMLSEGITPMEVCHCASQIHKLIRLKLDIINQMKR